MTHQQLTLELGPPPPVRSRPSSPPGELRVTSVHEAMRLMLERVQRDVAAGAWPPGRRRGGGQRQWMTLESRSDQ